MDNNDLKSLAETYHFANWQHEIGGVGFKTSTIATEFVKYLMNLSGWRTPLTITPMKNQNTKYNFVVTVHKEDK